MTEQKFEDALKRLEEIVANLENGDVPLEDTVKLFKEGIGLAKVCKNKLQTAEKEIKKIVKDNDGEFQLTILSE
ncbi:exodeoxyribonuclease VII small subunit [candidate division KSB1 bacterium]|nr:exodeoxyribonuclease VII small subunit [candidate division KSB1 bacterium]MCH8285113.1 exodeoxyribonuclease VII small subunit [candidate division KSB1 bacterium]